ncbi:MAG: MBL fold metallo-hydrolase [Candidatus Heimdallarchaeota archaeon]
MEYKTVNNELIWTDVGYGNSAAIDLGKKVFVIDSMLNWELAAEWRSVVEHHFDKPVSGLILTHHHEDHTFGNQVFSDVPIISSQEIRRQTLLFEKEIWVHESPDDRAEWEAGGYGVKNLVLTHSNVCFEKSLTLYGDKRLDLIEGDGHTMGSTYLWQPESKTLLSGDVVFARQFPYGGDETCNIVRWQQVIEELIALDPEIIISGHGPVATLTDLREINEFFVQSIAFLRNKLDEGLTWEEIAQDPHFPEYYSQDRSERKKVTIERWAAFFNKEYNR